MDSIYDLPAIRTDSNEDNIKYMDELMRELRRLNQLQLANPTFARHSKLLLNAEIERVWSSVYHGSNRMTSGGDWSPQSEIAFAPKGSFSLTMKVPFPDSMDKKSNSKCNLIGRILGPSGISLKQLEADTDCSILIRGEGSIKDPAQSARLVGQPGFEHLSEPLHVLIKSTDETKERGVESYGCEKKLKNAGLVINRLLVPQNDKYKREQLIQLAIIKGTYRPNK